MKKLLYAAIFILALAIIAYVAFLNVPQDSTKGKEASISFINEEQEVIDTPTQESTNEKGDIVAKPQAPSKAKERKLKLGAAILFAEYEKNEKKADKKFIGKIIDIEGQIMGIEKDEAGKGVVILDSGNGMDGIMCTLEDSETKKLATLKEGQKVKIRGKCAGKMMDVVFNKCLLLE